MNSNAGLVIRQAQVLTPEGELQRLDVQTEGHRILRLADHLPAVLPGVREIPAQGLTLLPGVIDPQVHFREPGLEHKEDLFTASCACARGGVTSFLEMPNTRPLTTDQAALEDKLARAAAKSLVNYGFFIGATADNLAVLNSCGPTPGIKIFMGSMHGPLLVDQDQTLEGVFAQGRRLIAVHAEDQARIAQRRQALADVYHPELHSLIQDNEAALLATKKVLALSHRYQRRLHILHLSTADEAELLYQDKPAWVTAEVTPQHLLLDTTAYNYLGSLAQMNPPLRRPRDRAVLWQALLEGIIDFIATDHAPHTLEEKALPYPQSPSGMPGVETSLPLMLTQAVQGHCRLSQVAHWMSRAPALAYGIPNKGLVTPGYDADLVLVDLEHYYPVRPQDLQTKCGWSPFTGWNLTGWPVVTVVGGQVAWDQGRVDPTVRGRPLSFNPRE